MARVRDRSHLTVVQWQDDGDGGSSAIFLRTVLVLKRSVSDHRFYFNGALARVVKGGLDEAKRIARNTALALNDMQGAT